MYFLGFGGMGKNGLVMIVLVVVFVILFDESNAFGSRKLVDTNNNQDSPSSSPPPNDKIPSAKNSTEAELNQGKNKDGKEAEFDTESCKGLPVCSDQEKTMIACIQDVVNGSNNLSLVVQNGKDVDLKVNIKFGTSADTNLPIFEITAHKTKKVNITFSGDKSNKVILNAGYGDCELQVSDPADSPTKPKEQNNLSKDTKPDSPSKSDNVDDPSKSKEVDDPSKSKDIGDPSKSKDVDDPSKSKDIGSPKSKDIDDPSKLKTKDVDDPSKSKDVDDPSKSKDVDDPSKSKDVDDPSKSKDVDDPSKSKDVDDPSKSKDVDDPSKSKDDPSKSKEADDSSKSKEADDPSKSKEADDPSKSKDVGDPSKSKDAKDPSKSTDTGPPSIPKTNVETPVSQNNFLDQLTFYSKQVTPIYGAYLAFLVALIIGGSWALCTFRKRAGNGVAYQELEMGATEPSNAVNVETAEGWDHDWDDDNWDEDEAIRSSGGVQTNPISSNGLTSRAIKKDGWDADWDD